MEMVVCVRGEGLSYVVVEGWIGLSPMWWQQNSGWWLGEREGHLTTVLCNGTHMTVHSNHMPVYVMAEQEGK